MYDSAAFVGDVKVAIEKLRENIKVDGYDVYLVSDHIHPYVMLGDNKEWEARAKSFDGVTSWLGGYSGKGRYLGGSYERQLEILYSKWGKWAKESQRKIFPFATPEFDGRYVSWGDPNSVPLERSPQFFEERMEIVLNYTRSPRVIMVGTWNDFFESTTLEPSREYEFTYLDVLKKMLEKYCVESYKEYPETLLNPETKENCIGWTNPFIFQRCLGRRLLHIALDKAFIQPVLG